MPGLEGKTGKGQINERRRMNKGFFGGQKEELACSAWIKKGLATGVISKIDRKKVRCLSNMFFIPKKDGKYRQILDCRPLNAAVKNIHFKMEDHLTLERLLEHNDFATTLDLSQAYFLVPVHDSFVPFLAFSFHEETFAFRGMPFGFKDAPRIFTRLMRKVLQGIREQWDVKCMAYLDDVILIHQDPIYLTEVTDKVIKWFAELGLMVNVEKSSVTPRQVFNFLGWTWRTTKITVSLERNRRKALSKECKRWMTKAKIGAIVKTRDHASFIGSISAVRFVCKDAGLQMNRLYALQNRIVRKNGWDGEFAMNYGVFKQISYWESRLKKEEKRDLEIFSVPDAILTTDAAPRACGAILEVNGTCYHYHQPFDRRFISQSSNFKETLAVVLSLNHFEPYIKKYKMKNLLLRSDNSSVVFNINRWAAGRNLICIIRKIRRAILQMGINVKAFHLPGVLNGAADSLSRLERSGDYQITRKGMEEVQKQLNVEIEQDAFASQGNSKAQIWFGPGSPFAEDG
ncbi:putative Reverse transcriptase (RNA-dependent DNA polymerase) [Monocercomonoides exilis]|uniref:putative Reverse transcriptase (RNA-dependent DNA polymerase) n=1 Tax=Monocercomonoides exilis TaxID=2049356 RepID=UPI003559CC4B|nr:putative Reverse transcriptase (RNA-dependent DNA polymerase) [Monocercomonoides exilis]|eukprot:MONOS_13230.1-p1 / transcript=MONOS_13230.1 / gene=MONOS_13230 / organism=Monocercomonoides_exilis_PA203 / gene_product=ORF3 / transcript_product=ORF3 / location=Mono_scaffold00794:16217-17761(-) / protein_length=514 / sequence_SO=supercontig / SO=protein_coding / is_pseudo=false